MKTRVLHTKFWRDPYVRKLTAGEKLVYNYLITNEKVNIIHCYELDIDEIVFDLGLSVSTIRDALKKLQNDGKIAYRNGWVFLGNASKYERYTGDRNDTARDKILREMSNPILDWYNNLCDRGIKGVYIPSINHKSEIINKSKGVVKGELSQEDLTEIANDYQVSLAFVLSKQEDMMNWCKAKGESYRDYKAALRTWVKKDAVSLIKESRKGVKSLDATQILRSQGGQGGDSLDPRGIQALEGRIA